MRSRLIAAWALSWGAVSSLYGGTLSGRLISADGNPVPNARVAWFAFSDPARALADATSGASPKPLGETRTDAEGRFRASLDPAGPLVALRLEADRLPWARLRGPYDPAATNPLPDVELPAAAAVSGSVAGGGKPAPGARLSVVAGLGLEDGDPEFFAEATSGPDGAFRIENAPAGPLRVSVRAAGFVPAARLLRFASTSERFALERGGAIEGSVLDASGRGLGAAIVFTGNVAAVSGNDGRYRLDAVAPGLRSVEAQAAGNLVGRRSGVRVAAGQAATADVTLAKGGEIAGTAVDALTRRPLSGVRLRIADSAGARTVASEAHAYARSDARGRFTVMGLLPGDYDVRGDRAGYLAASLPRVKVSAAAPGGAALALTPAASISGRVVDAQGKAVRGAIVSLEPPRGNRGRFGGARAALLGPGRATTTRSAPDGTFRIDGLPAISSGVPLVAAHAGYANAERPGVTLKAGQALANVVLALALGTSAKGRVVDEAGKAVAGAEIRVAASEGRGPRRMFRPFEASAPPNAVTAADGSFAVSGLADGLYDVTATHAGFSPKTSPALRVSAKTPAPWPPIVLPAGAAVSGVVHDDQGAPLTGASVMVLGEGIEPSEASTDATGAFRLTDLAKGRPLMLSATAQGYGFAQRSVTPPADDIALVLGKAGMIRGRAVDGATGEPVRAFSISVAPAARGRRGFGGGAGAPGLSQVADDGSFEMPVAPGTWNLHATADGYRPADVANIEIEAGQTREGVEVSLKRGGSLIGHVTDSRGSPVPTANVSCCDAGNPPGGLGGSGGSGPTAASDGDGRFELDGLPDGHVTLTITHPDYVTATRDVDPATTSDFLITLSTGGDISGTVVSGDGGSPVPSASVRLDPQGDSGTAVGASQTAESDGGGGFRFDHLTAGRYRLTAQTKTASSTPQDLVLADGQPMDGVRVSVATGVEVDGVVSGLAAAQLSGVNVNASATGFNGSAVTSDDGHFTLTSVPPGVVRFSASTGMPNVRTVSKTVEISGDDPQTQVEIAFEGGSRLSGLVTQNGKPVSPFSVTATPDPPDGSGRRYTAMSDGSGRYDIEDITDGAYQVTVVGSGSPYRTTLTVSGDTNGDVAMPAATISGVVTDGATGSPLEAAAVQAQTGAEATAQGIKRTVTDSTGAYTLTDVDPGDYQVSARKDGYQLKTQTATVGGDAATLDFALDAGSGLSLQVFDGLSGMPLGGVTALAFGAGGAIAYSGSIALDQTGLGQVPSLPPGRYSVYVFSSGYAPFAIASANVPSDPVRVTLTPGGRVEARSSSLLSGRIVDAGGNPVLLAPNRLDGSATVAPPVAVWQHLAPGSYSFLVPNGSAETPYPFTVAEGQTTTLSLP